MKGPVHLNALRAFEASARHQSFSSAAAELNVTPAAVGQLVRSLEEWLGTPLFHRGTSGRSRLIPTETAERALPDIRAGFDRLSLGLDRLREGSRNGVLTVAVSPSFAGKWLMPRIERFHEMWPETDVRLDTNLKLVDFTAQGIDIGVRYGRGSWPGLVAEKLMDEQVYVVCSPAWLAKNGKLRTPTDLAGKALIHDLSVDTHLGFASWSDWLKRAGVENVDARRGMRINNSAAVLQAVVDGHGVALARSVLARDDLAAGRLVQLFPKVKWTSELAYYIVYRGECSSLPKLVAFREWLIQEAASAQ
ncbi:Glycine cleavage system transcriptional activator [Paraburkholderia piptadeniae]|uniref:Transcriptional regulator GcvA n=2 Tax=Paraburkholderia TaxID=1822464 RepID=A0A7X1NEM5_9BURK|nr:MULTISPECIES: transcriptional regulator GcvA [Paraburkholderia]MPW20464.1 transcriptional regulator GcvA [Paraburkholderia franconis]SIT50885.1 Glycine cleavage system transcriptional activator [Paraburkholderia piptadeniae]